MCYLLLQIAIAQRAVVPLLIEVLIGIWRRGDAQEGEQILYHLWFRTVGLCRASIGHGLHHFLGDGLLIVAQIDTVARALSHLAAAIETRHLERLITEVEILWLWEKLHTINIIEAAGTLAHHLHVLLLILAHWHLVCAMLQHIGSHQRGIGEQTGIHIIGLLASLFLERSNTLKLTKIHIHIEVQI